jgi:hypothetical protein
MTLESYEEFRIQHWIDSTSSKCVLCIARWRRNQIGRSYLFVWRTKGTNSNYRQRTCMYEIFLFFFSLFVLVFVRTMIELIEDTFWTIVWNLCASSEYLSRRGFIVVWWWHYTAAGMTTRVFCQFSVCFTLLIACSYRSNDVFVCLFVFRWFYSLVSFSGCRSRQYRYHS